MKIKLRKYQSGGAIPPLFTTYKSLDFSTVPDPTLNLLASLGQQTTTTQTTASNKSSSGDSISLKDTMDLLTKIRGLDNDTSTALNYLKKVQSNAANMAAFGQSGTSALVSQYYDAVEMANKVAESKEAYKDAYEQAKNQKALSEYATTSTGKLVALGQDKQLHFITPEQFAQNAGKFQLQTNQDLLYLRRHDSNMAFQDNILDIVNNSTSMDNIRSIVNDFVNNLKENSQSMSGYQYSDGYGNIAGGIKALQQLGKTNAANMGLPGIYKTTVITKDQKQQALEAIEAIKGQLTPNQLALLKIHSDGTDKGAAGLIANMVMSRTGSSTTFDVDYQTEINKQAGQSSDKDSNGKSKEPDSNAAVDFILGQGQKQEILLAPKSSDRAAISTIGRYGYFQTHDGSNIGQGATLQDATKSTLGGALDWNKATFGGSLLRDKAYNQIILKSSDVVGMDLPVTYDQNTKTPIPDLSELSNISAADEEIETLESQGRLRQNDYNAINKIYIKHHVTAKYDAKGNLLQNWKHFAAVQATVNEDSLVNPAAAVSDMVSIADNTDRQLYEQNVQKATDNKKYELHNGFIGIGREDLYNGTIFIPVRDDVVNAYMSAGDPQTQSAYNKIKEQQYAPAFVNYKKPSVSQAQLLQ